MSMDGTLPAGNGACISNGPVGMCFVVMACMLYILKYWNSLLLHLNSIMLIALSLILNDYLDIVENT